MGRPCVALLVALVCLCGPVRSQPTTKYRNDNPMSRCGYGALDQYIDIWNREIMNLKAGMEDIRATKTAIQDIAAMKTTMQDIPAMKQVIEAIQQVRLKLICFLMMFTITDTQTHTG